MLPLAPWGHIDFQYGLRLVFLPNFPVMFKIRRWPNILYLVETLLATRCPDATEYRVATFFDDFGEPLSPKPNVAYRLATLNQVRLMTFWVLPDDTLTTTLFALAVLAVGGGYHTTKPQFVKPYTDKNKTGICSSSISRAARRR